MTLSRFDEAAPQWDQNPERVALARAVGDTIARTVPLDSAWRVLDYGAGTGLLTLNLLPRVSSILALDASSGMLEQFQHKLVAAKIRNVEARFWNLEQAPFDRAGFDLIASSMTMHHIRDVATVINRLAALLKPGGWLGLADLEAEDGSFHGQASDVFHNGFAPEQINSWLVHAGLKQVSIQRVYLIRKPASTGELQEYPVFLATAQKLHP